MIRRPLSPLSITSIFVFLALQTAAAFGPSPVESDSGDVAELEPPG